MRDLVGGGVFLVIGALAIYLGSDLAVGRLRLPGPGAMPMIAGIAIVLLSLALGARGLASLRPAARSNESVVERWGYVRIGATMVLIAAYTAVLPWLGFLAGTILLMTALFMLGSERPFGWGPPVAGVVVTGAAYVLFVTLLDVHLPVGSLWGR